MKGKNKEQGAGRKARVQGMIDAELQADRALPDIIKKRSAK